MLTATSDQELPAGLEEMSPGPALAAVPASVDRSRLCGFDVVVVLKARARQVAYEQAELQADMVAVADRVKAETTHLSTVWDSDIPKFAAAEIAAALTWTKRAARDRLDEAWFLTERLPMVWEALRDGLIDLPRARVFADATAVLSEQTARRVTARLLPEAPALTTGMLAYRLRNLVADADPAAAKNNYERGVGERRVTKGTNPDGTAYLYGTGLPAEETAAAFERLDAMARAAKQAGDSRPMDQIRCDVFLGLLSGTWQGPGPIHRRGVLELTCDLPTLAGLAESSADLNGFGPVIAEIARKIAEAMAQDGDTVWRYTITDPVPGRLLHHDTTQARPNLPATPLPAAPGTGRPARRKDPRRNLTSRDRALVIARDRTCRGPGCRVPANRAEIDHLVPHAAGGPSRPSNTDCKCGYCHDLRDAGWTVVRDAFGQTHWTTPLGHHYTVPPEPITAPQRLSPLERHLFETVRMRR
ncbi:HNH endonuclease signature motif containing protein [Actinomadura sp. HBU206391]|uniref:HNH endonuclease signature motif containing protein n=1 Tax=Actinomadura sp. HBU206391 TaxID=2731692 RepID=UPI0016503B9C|nr:HNH endonuclease signature motif containing protein [Actinomadura sp. HBU206391]MBC6457799.1 DUF222 domain-containing protein [Actinomadura sp. HBU206391]